jgi:hypothetical protein
MGINHKVLKNRNTRSWHGFCVVKGLFIIGRFSVPAIDLGGITTIKMKESGALGMFLMAAISCAAIFSQSANAVIAEPADLSNGDQYRLIFITAGTIDALSADIADHNTFVNAQAALSTDATIQALTWGMLGSHLGHARLDGHGRRARQYRDQPYADNRPRPADLHP